MMIILYIPYKWIRNVVCKLGIVQNYDRIPDIVDFILTKHILKNKFSEFQNFKKKKKHPIKFLVKIQYLFENVV